MALQTARAVILSSTARGLHYSRCFLPSTACQNNYRPLSRTLSTPALSLTDDSRLRLSLEKAGFTKPTNAQSKFLAHIKASANHPCLVLGAETGSGKTLAYCIPILEHFLANRDLTRPSALIFAPSLELTQQIARVLKQVTEGLNVVVSQLDGKEQLSDFKDFADIVVSPAALLSKVDWKEYFSSPPSFVVLDEFDALLTGSHEHATWKLLKEAAAHHWRNAKPDVIPATTTLLVGATLPDRGEKSVMSLLTHQIPKLDTVTSEKVHRAVPSLQQVFISLQKENELLGEERLSHIEKAIASGRTAEQNDTNLVFCNTVRQVETLTAALQDKFSVKPFHGRLSLHERQQTLAAFERGELDAVVSTDLLSRGIDLHVDRVIQAFFATNVSTYMHRIGRTARCNKSGMVVNIVGEGDAFLAQEIEQAVHRTDPVFWWNEGERMTQAENEMTSSAAVAEEERAKLSALFSRNRGFRARRKKHGKGGHRQ